MAQKKIKSAAREIGEIVFAFFVAWLGYQALALATGTNMPIVSVVSDSMYHQSPEFDQWWHTRNSFYEDIGVSEVQFQNFPVRNGLSRGDLLFVINSVPKVGDVVIYQSPTAGYTIVHRVVQIRSDGYIVKGDNNVIPDPLVQFSQVKGKVVFAVPILGYPRLLLFNLGI